MYGSLPAHMADQSVPNQYVSVLVKQLVKQ